MPSGMGGAWAKILPRHLGSWVRARGVGGRQRNGGGNALRVRRLPRRPGAKKAPRSLVRALSTAHATDTVTGRPRVAHVLAHTGGSSPY